MGGGGGGGYWRDEPYRRLGSLRSMTTATATATSTKTSPQNITLQNRKFLAVRPSRSSRIMWAKYPKNKLVRAISETERVTIVRSRCR